MPTRSASAALCDAAVGLQGGEDAPVGRRKGRERHDDAPLDEFGQIMTHVEPKLKQMGSK